MDRHVSSHHTHHAKTREYHKIDLSENDQPNVRDFSEDTNQMNKVMIGGIFVVLVGLGVGTGYILARTLNQSSDESRNNGMFVQMEQSKKAVGVADTKAFPDSATGILEAGGLDGEGTHKLIREGGPSQTVYLISSLVDLDQFLGKEVTVWGQTMAAKKAAWLMDVGRVELEE